MHARRDEDLIVRACSTKSECFRSRPSRENRDTLKARRRTSSRMKRPTSSAVVAGTFASIALRVAKRCIAASRSSHSCIAQADSYLCSLSCVPSRGANGLLIERSQSPRILGLKPAARFTSDLYLTRSTV